MPFAGPFKAVQFTFLRSVTHLFFIVGPDQNMATKRHYNLYPGLILGAFCTILRAPPVGTGLGAKFCQKPVKNQNENYNFDYLF